MTKLIWDASRYEVQLGSRAVEVPGRERVLMDALTTPVRTGHYVSYTALQARGFANRGVTETLSRLRGRLRLHLDLPAGDLCCISTRKDEGLRWDGDVVRPIGNATRHPLADPATKRPYTFDVAMEKLMAQGFVVDGQGTDIGEKRRVALMLGPGGRWLLLTELPGNQSYIPVGGDDWQD